MRRSKVRKYKRWPVNYKYIQIIIESEIINILKN